MSYYSNRASGPYGGVTTNRADVGLHICVYNNWGLSGRNGPIINNVQLGSHVEWSGRNSYVLTVKVSSGPSGSYYTNHRAWVFEGPNHDARVGSFFPGRVMDSSAYISRSKFSTKSESNVAIAGYGGDSGFGPTRRGESYVPVPIDNKTSTVRYPDSGVTHHVCRDASTLNTSAPYTTTIPLLKGHGTRSKIKYVGSSTLDTIAELLHLSNVLHVPSIRKNLLSMSQFVRENNVYFEFHLFRFLIKDIQTQAVLM